MKKQLILSVFASQYWALEPKYMETMSSVLQRWAAGTSATPEVMADVQAAQADRAARRQSAANVGGGIAVLPVFGVITQRAPLVDNMSGSGGTNVESVVQSFRDSMADSSVGGIVLLFDTPGGSVFGIPGLFDEIMQARGVKPVYGYVSSLCASAGYWTAAGCQAIYAEKGSMIGSIGVYTQFTDCSAAMEMDGLKTEFISAGKFKVEGNPFGPLTDEARAATQAQIDSYYGMFTSAVAKGRGVPVASVRDGMGQGRCLLAADALAAGMIDGIDTLDGVVKRMKSAMKSGGANASVDVAGVMANGAVIDLDEPGMAERLANSTVTKIEEPAVKVVIESFPAAAEFAHRSAARTRELEIAAL